MLFLIELRLNEFNAKTDLKAQPYGEGLIKAYYEDAPAIVNFLDNQPNRSEIYQNIYEQIQKIVKLVEMEENEKAIILYMHMVYALSRRAFSK